MYALLQPTLDLKIPRETLEEASVVAPSVARGDCARLARELFGIVVRDLPLQEAQAFQSALARKGVQTELVRLADLPLLVPPVRRRGIRFEGDHFTAFDGLGRGDRHPWSEVQFAAGGLVHLTKYQQKNALEWGYRSGPHGSISRFVEVRPGEKVVKEEEFRLELFLSCEPYRLQFPAREDSLLRMDDLQLRFRQKDALLSLLSRVAALLPPACQNQGMLAAGRGEWLRYPNPGSFDEELTWHLFQSLRHG
jgi:hypothetical protein